MESPEEGSVTHAAEGCAQCGGSYEARLVSVTLPTAASGYAVLRNVPAEVCRECGDTRFALPVTQRMLAWVHGARAPVGVMQVPVYDLG